MNKKNICLALDMRVDDPGGTQVLVRELVLGLSSFYNIVLASIDQTTSLSKEVQDSLHAHIELPIPHAKETGKVLLKRLCELKIDAIHFHIGGTYTWQTRNIFECPIHVIRRANIPYYITNHGAFGFFGYCGNHRSLLFRYSLLVPVWVSQVMLIKGSQSLLAVSKSDCKKLKKWFFPVANKVSQVYHSILPKHLPSLSHERKKQILCVGTFGHRKGQWLLADAFGKIHRSFPDWNLIFVGRIGDDLLYKETVDHLVKSASISKTSFLQNLSNLELESLYLESEVFVMPSLEEGLGLTLQEALYHGCACISAKAGGTEDLIHHNYNGLLVDRGSVEHLASSLKTLLCDAELRSKFKKQGPETIRQNHMSKDEMISYYTNLYRAS